MRFSSSKLSEAGFLNILKINYFRAILLVNSSDWTMDVVTSGAISLAVECEHLIGCSLKVEIKNLELFQYDFMVFVNQNDTLYAI